VGESAEACVGDAAPERCDPIGSAVRDFGPVAERRTEQPPQGLAGERDCDEDEQRMPKRLVCDRLQRALLIGGGTAAADRELPGEDADDHVYEPARDEAGPGRPLEASASQMFSAPPRALRTRSSLTGLPWAIRLRASR
jgi:hypothetical protein